MTAVSDWLRVLKSDCVNSNSHTANNSYLEQENNEHILSFLICKTVCVGVVCVLRAGCIYSTLTDPLEVSK